MHLICKTSLDCDIALFNRIEGADSGEFFLKPIGGSLTLLSPFRI